MATKAQARSKSKKSGATATDRRILEQAAREDAEGKGSASTLRSVKGPAAVLREAKARIEAIHAAAPPIPRFSHHKDPAAVAAEKAGKVRDEIRNISVPITLARACDLVGYDVRPDDFVASAFDALARDIDTLADLAESDEIGYEGWSIFRHLAERVRFAGEIATLLATETTTEPALVTEGEARQ